MNIRQLFPLITSGPISDAVITRSAFKVAISLLAMLSLASCASLNPVDTQASKQASPIVSPIGSRPDGGIRVDTTNERVAQLWAAAEQARQGNKSAIALELIYEALELSPQNSLLWSRAAELQLDDLEAVLAESYAVKSNAFSAENPTLLYRNWLIIEQARNMRGDLLGVRSAHKKVQEYQYQ